MGRWRSVKFFEVGGGSEGRGLSEEEDCHWCGGVLEEESEGETKEKGVAVIDNKVDGGKLVVADVDENANPND